MDKAKLLSRIDYTRKFVRSSRMTSGNEYKIILSYNGHWASFVFHDNCENKSTLVDWLYCLILDMDAYEFCHDVDEFAREYGYEPSEYVKASKAYLACKKTAEKLHRLFTNDELDILSEIE